MSNQVFRGLNFSSKATTAMKANHLLVWLLLILVGCGNGMKSEVEQIREDLERTKEILVQATDKIERLTKEVTAIKARRESHAYTAPYSESEDIIRGQASHILRGQILIKAVETSDEFATFRMTFPDGEVFLWEEMAVGSRRILEFEGNRYYFDLMKAYKYGATISIRHKPGLPSE